MLLKYIEFAFNKGLSASTITSQLSAVSYIHKLANVSDPAQSFIIKKMLKGVQKLRPQIDIRLPFNINHVSSMIESMVKISSSPYIRALFNAMYSLAFHALLRVGEFTSSLPLSPNLILVQHINQNISSQQLSITFFNYKHSSGHTPISFLITPQPNISCPCLNLSRYLSLRGLTPGPLFCFPGGDPVSRSAFMSKFKQTLQLIGLDPKFYKGHSFRIGKATELALSGIPDHVIQARGRWHSSAFTKYIRILNI